MLFHDNSMHERVNRESALNRVNTVGCTLHVHFTFYRQNLFGFSMRIARSGNAGENSIVKNAVWYSLLDRKNSF